MNPAACCCGTRRRRHHRADTGPLRVTRLSVAERRFRWRSSENGQLIVWHPQIKAWCTPCSVNGQPGWRALTYRPVLAAMCREVFIRVGTDRTREKE